VSQPSVDTIIAYETGDLSVEDTLKLFGQLVKNGMAWTLQGHYGRTAASLIERGLIDRRGEVDWDRFEEVRAE
jgi:hypothetical protein